MTVDIHTHLLSPEVRFDRLYDRIAIRFFARSLGTTAEALHSDPYGAYTTALIGSVRASEHVERVCLFPVDMRLDTHGKEIGRDRTVCSTTEDVLALHATAPDALIPFLSVNPLRRDALERIEQYAAAGCRGAKLLQNYWGIDLNERRLAPYFERLAALGIPLVIHIGSEYSIESLAAYERVEMLKQPLEAGCTVIAAHMGLGRIEHRALPWRNLSGNPAHFDRDYFTLLELLEAHDNLYADLAAILAPLRARALRHLSEQHHIHHKLLFASDYPVPFTTRLNSYDLPWGERRRLARIANPFDAYAEALLNYFPAENAMWGNWVKVLGSAEP